MQIKLTTKTGQTSDSIVRLGTAIYMTEAVDINGTSYSSFVVEDNFWIDMCKDSERLLLLLNWSERKQEYVQCWLHTQRQAIERFEENGENRLIDIDDVQMTAEEAV